MHKNTGGVHVIEVEAHSRCLNSNDCFIIMNKTHVGLWKSRYPFIKQLLMNFRGSTPELVEYAKKAITKLQKSRIFEHELTEG